MFDSLFEDFDAVMIMTIFGIVFGFGAALTRSLYINFAAFSIILLIYTLNINGAVEEPFLGTIIGFVLTSAILILSVAKQRGYF
jgi:predicted neutral ceramidase superfamily lipid hydrolase